MGRYFIRKIQKRDKQPVCCQPIPSGEILQATQSKLSGGKYRRRFCAPAGKIV
jgi:hypothetical protein